MKELTLGDFLRTRRASLAPGDREITTRRVPGLRREEVARRVGVSVDYYVKLEQGKRRITPSGNVLHALAEVLELDDPAREHMFDLARLDNRPKMMRESTAQTVRPGTFRLMESFSGLPAILVGRRTDVLATNPLARRLIHDFPALPARERNAVRWVLSESARDIHQDWYAAATGLIGMLRMDFGRYPNDPKTIALIDEMNATSDDFRAIWADGRVARGFTIESKVILHAEVGPVKLHVEAVRITEDPDQTLHVMIPGSDPSSQQAMVSLRRLTGVS